MRSILTRGTKNQAATVKTAEISTRAELTPDDLLVLDLGPETGETMHSADGNDR